MLSASACAALVALALLLRTPRTLTASASGQYDAQHAPEAAVDGADTTDWLLPDRSTGALEVRLAPPRKIGRVRLMNARNLPWNDRGAREISVDAYDGARAVKSSVATFEATSPEPTWRTVEVGAKIDRVRVEVRSWHGLGGGLAEISVE